MDLTDLIDLEAQIAADAGAEPEGLRARDRAIGASLDTADEDRAALLSAWLEALRARRGGEPSPGTTVVRAHRSLGALLALAGLASGAGATAAALAYDGSTPINVASFLAAFVGVPIGLLLILALSLGIASAWPDLADRVPIVGELRALLGWAVRALSERARGARRRADDPRLEAWAATWHRLRARTALYRPVERWWLTATAQTFAIAFFVAALGTFSARVALSDLAFSWSTTLELDAAAFHRLTTALSLPWAPVWPEAVPSLHLVELSRYSRLDGAYVGAIGGRTRDVVLVGQWWRFLFAALLAYGLLPRLALALLSRWRLRVALTRLPLDTPDVDRVVRRLRSPRVETRGLPAEPAPSPARTAATAAATTAGASSPAARAETDRSAPVEPEAEPDSTAGASTPEPAPIAAAERDAVLVLWRDVPADVARVGRALDTALGWGAGAICAAGGAEFEADESTQARVAATVGPVALVAEAWEAPDKATLRFLRGLRLAVGPRRPMAVVLVEPNDDGRLAAPAAEQVKIWRERTAALADPYLAVEAIGEPS